MCHCSYSSFYRDTDIAILSVCPSVRPSVRDTLVLYENGLIYRHSFFHHMVAQSSCFTSIKHLHEIPTGSPRAGALTRGGYENVAIFDQ